MLIGYVRVSTAAQASTGTSLQTQREELEAAGCGRIYADTISGAKDVRPQMEDMLKNVRPGDVIVVTKLDRLGRSMRHLVNLVADLKEEGVHLRSLSEGIDTSTPTGDLVLGIFSSLAEFERTRILERTATGRAAAEAQGRKGGRPRSYDAAKIRRAHEVHEIPGLSPKAKAAEVGVSVSQFYKLLKMNPERA